MNTSLHSISLNDALPSPTANDKWLKVYAKSLFQGVDRVSTIASEKTRAVKVGLDKDRITLSVTSPENGTAAEELAAGYDSDAMEIGFNARYLSDILGQVDGDKIGRASCRDRVGQNVTICVVAV